MSWLKRVLIAAVVALSVGGAAPKKAEANFTDYTYRIAYEGVAYIYYGYYYSPTVYGYYAYVYAYYGYLYAEAAYYGSFANNYDTERYCNYAYQLAYQEYWYTYDLLYLYGAVYEYTASVYAYYAYNYEVDYVPLPVFE